ncbi:Hypothetical protein PP7435_CHR1-0431 [Komagataella phaffii CBS 7435]|uniref:Uncharacterized protein n=1 Tax=Komagataella phaffii (strain ATCC 76273 / CBS 7435 / CECT 11047 / NRRL Y-11430 / Wegner 21-1) TaxID=981350 RepID=F2QMD7_KOMPC|nr:Hypothetical protein BQ9382_C1-2246 [Komagataella phaffii CBS 7435]CCA36584.1 Hypothetical protein PP7435_CHR1-0431 [Komagataella phaffii CBS 7435]
MCGVDLEEFFGIDSERNLVRLILGGDIVDNQFSDWLRRNEYYNFKLLLGLTPSDEKHDFVFHRLQTLQVHNCSRVKTRLNAIVLHLCEECDVLETTQLPLEVVLFIVTKIAGQFPFLFQAQPTCGDSNNAFLDLFMDNWPLVIMFKMLFDENIKYAKGPKIKDLRVSEIG